jgi:hypothetical protein
MMPVSGPHAGAALQLGDNAYARQHHAVIGQQDPLVDVWVTSSAACACRC